MNLLAFNIGILISIFIILRFKKSRLESGKLTYSLLLITFPFYYIAFAIYGDDYRAIQFEFLGGSVFIIIAITSLKFDNFYRFNLLAFGYILHGIYDVFHKLFFTNAGTPIWWPEFCGVIDITLGLYLVVLAFRSRESVA